MYVDMQLRDANRGLPCAFRWLRYFLWLSRRSASTAEIPLERPRGGGTKADRGRRNRQGVLSCRGGRGTVPYINAAGNV